MTRRLTPFGLFALALAVSHAAAADPTPVKGRVDAVTVYRGQALVTRVIELPKEPGLRDLVVTDLPAGVVPGSVYAEVDGDAEVRHVRQRTRAVQDDVRDDVRTLDEQLAALAASVDAEKAHVDVLARHGQYLDKLEGFAAPTANVELTRGVLNAETLQKLTSFILGERERVAKETLAAHAKINGLTKQSELLARQRAEITGRAEKTAREAVLMVDVRQPGATVRLRYLVTNASWSPSYTVHAKTGQPDVGVHYQAVVQQMSGEDWTDVRMTLSTATPNVVARAPDLDALRVSLANAPAAVADAVRSDEYARNLVRNRAEAAKQYMGNSNNHGKDGQNVLHGDGSVDFRQNPFASIQRDNIFTARKAASELQQAELVLDRSATVALRTAPMEPVTVTYVLPAATSLPSRADQQLVGISKSTMKGEFYKLAVPVLISYVYNEAQVVNAGKQLLLAGPAMSYLDGEFVGAGELPTVAAGEAFVVGFGIDATLRVTRELADKADATSGGNKISTFNYAITVENFGAAEAKVRVVDRIPLANAREAGGKELKVTLVASDPKPVDDGDALRKRGQIRWDLTAKPGAIGADAVKVAYSLSIEHDRNLSLVGAKE